MSEIKTYFVAIARLAFGLWGVGRNVSVLLLSLVVLFLGATAGLELVFTQYAGQLWLRMLAIVFLFLVFVVAPYRLWLVGRRDLETNEEKIASLQARLTTSAATQELVDQLWSLRDEGVKIRNERIKEHEEATWMLRYEDWRRRILEAARELSPNLRRDLEVLDQTGDPPAGVNPVSKRHARDVRIASEITKRLAEYLKRHYP